MFATSDGTAFHFVRVFVDAPDRSEELAIPPSLDDDVLRAQIFPADHFLRRLAVAVADRERRHGRAVSLVRVEAWRVEFSGVPVKGTERRLRSFTLYVSPPALLPR